jgi:hypothetical protein
MTERLSVKVLQPESQDLSFFDAIDMTWFYCAAVVCSNAKIIAGLCVYNNTYVKQDGNPVVFVGNIKCDDSAEMFSLLINEAEKVAENVGAKCIIGPLNGSTWDAYRFSVTNTVPVFSGDIAQDLYYNNLMLKNGFKTLHKYYSSVSLIQDIYNQEPLPSGVTIRNIISSKFEEELMALYPMCVHAFADNVLFSPIDEVDFVKKHIAFKEYIDTDFVKIAEDDQGIVALFFCYKGLYGKIPALVIKTIARHTERRYKGLIEMMAKKVYNKALAQGIQYIIHAFMHEQNKSLILSARYGGNRINEYAVYIKYLHD